MDAIIKYVQLVPTMQPFEAIQGPQGEQGAIIRSLCRMLDIAHQMQLLRIKRNPDLAAALHYLTIDTPGGPQQVAMLESWAIAVWLAGLHTSRLSPKSQEVARILKQHAHTAIARAFLQPEVVTESPPAFAAPVPETLPASPSWDRVLAGMEEVIEGLREVKADQAGLEQRVMLLEQANLGSRVAKGGRLSAQQIGQVFLQLQVLRQQTGISIEEAEKRLAAQFGVAHVIDIDASEWRALTRAILVLFQS